ncbi:unnamed protein product [Clonostachys chloroleuca]|uniref:RRM domain-containing protein n=1 Tax=Clonostachys chloroleuca TaxID=1926264 RepID=A0AA35MAT9_9HYPO|nr:unnamed protein product [Clonostachys chloroleuca]
MPEPEAELHATADLSPVSPSPIHTASPLVVPALQDTVDTIDAMVGAALATNGEIGLHRAKHDLIDTVDEDDVVDDDSFNDPYAEDTPTETAVVPPTKEETDVANDDDYAKTFDSPVGSEKGDGEDEQEASVSSVLRESNNISSHSGALNTHPSVASQFVLDTSPAQPSAGSHAPAQPAADAAFQRPSDSNHSNTDPSLPQSAHGGHSADRPERPSSADLQQLVADLTRPQPTDENHNLDPSAQFAQAGQSSGPPPQTSPSAALPPSSSLPPRPPQPNAAPQTYASLHHPAGSVPGVPVNVAAPPNPGQPSTYVAAGAPGTSTEAISNLPPPPPAGLASHPSLASMTSVPFPAQAGYPADGEDDYQRKWDQFIADERQYMSEAKWDRFPEGSRIFIGNLSSDKVSKRNVFDMFHKYGRLAQISLKSAYGFVQYHTIDEGQRAIDNLQGAEIKGRRIHLEVSKLQDKSKKERPRSPDKGRGRDGGRRNDRYANQGRDEYRHGGGRPHSPRRNEYNGDSYGRERGYYEAGRGRNRSRSPGYGRSGNNNNNRDSYRHRSPSPYGRSHNDGGEIDLPRRYGADVPDVQIILQPDVSREFVNWVESAFKAKALKTEVMFLHPRIPKDQVIQRQAVEGVQAVVDLDMRAQQLGKIPVQAFDRSAGSSNVRFDQYVDLDPNIAAEVIVRTKASAMPSYGQPYGGALGGYGQPYNAPSQQPAPVSNYPLPQSAAYPPQQPAANTADIAKLLGNVDNTTLQRLLSSIQGAPSGAIPAAMPHGNVPPAAQPDIQAILGSLSGGAPAHQHHVSGQAQYPQSYPPQGPPGPPAQSPGGGDSAAQVQNIMAQLARYRQ